MILILFDVVEVDDAVRACEALFALACALSDKALTLTLKVALSSLA